MIQFQTEMDENSLPTSSCKLPVMGAEVEKVRFQDE